MDCTWCLLITKSQKSPKVNFKIMKNVYQVNYWSVLITILLSLTFWGGIIALPILGTIQIVISLIIINRFKTLTKTNRILFTSYAVLTVFLIIFFKQLKGEELGILFMWAIVSLFLACFHLYITYNISKS